MLKHLVWGDRELVTRADFQWRDWDTNPSKKNFDLQFVLLTKYAGKDGTDMKEWLTNERSTFETQAMRGSSSLTLLMIF